MADEPVRFTVESVHENFNIEAGIMVLRDTDGVMMPWFTDDYHALRQKIAQMRSIDIDAVDVVGMTLTLDEDGIPMLPPDAK